MKTCRVCREPLPEIMPGECPSCFITFVDNNPEITHDPGMLHVGFAIARALDRLTKQLQDDAEEREKSERRRHIAEKLGMK